MHWDRHVQSSPIMYKSTFDLSSVKESLPLLQGMHCPWLSAVVMVGFNPVLLTVSNGMSHAKQSPVWTCFLCEKNFATFNLNGDPMVPPGEMECPE